MTKKLLTILGLATGLYLGFNAKSLYNKYYAREEPISYSHIEINKYKDRIEVLKTEKQILQTDPVVQNMPYLIPQGGNTDHGR